MEGATARSGTTIFPKERRILTLTPFAIALRPELISWALVWLRQYLAVAVATLLCDRPDVVLISDGASIPKRETIGILMTDRATQPYIISSEANPAETPERRLRKVAADNYRNTHYALFSSAR